MTTQSSPETLKLTWSEALTNYNLNSAILHTISKTPSTSNEEFEIKYNVTEEMKNVRHRYGRGVQIGTMGGLILFCMKSNMIKTKVFVGFMYTYWIAHFYTLGAHLGLYLRTKWAADQLAMGTQYPTGRMTQEYIKMLRERNENKAKGLPYISESDFVREFHLMGASQETKENYATTSYVENDYFQKNFQKYAKSDPTDSDPNKVFVAQSNSDYEDELKVPLIDCFFTRYVYHNTARWVGRLRAFLGIASH